MSQARKPDRRSPGKAYMNALRQDHASLSRVLRLIDALADRLSRSPESVKPVLLDALRYLFQYHHAFHHPREDRLFARIRARRPALEETLGRIDHEHVSGEQEIAALVGGLENANTRQLAGKPGARLAARIGEYVQHARIHMRDEEVVFYARAEAALNEADWTAIVDDDGPQDPLLDPDSIANQYPALAEHLGLAAGYLSETADQEATVADFHRQLIALTDVYGSLLHDGLDLTRANVKRLLAVRGPFGLLRTVGDISTDNLRFAGHCVSRPSRWAINTGCTLVLAWARPYLPRQASDNSFDRS